MKGIIPDQWKAYTVPRGATVIQWITDFSQRVKQLQEISQQVAQFGAGELKVHTLLHPWHLENVLNNDSKYTAICNLVCTRCSMDVSECNSVARRSVQP